MLAGRRLFFDDGKSRKRWQIVVSGKSVIVRFGRLTGALRETKKTGKSPADAQKLAEQFVAHKLREGYVEVNPKRLEVVRTKGARPANEKQITTLEQALGTSLPIEYRNFLKTCNGGRPNPDCVRVPGAPGIDNVGVGTLFHLQLSKPGVDEITYELERTKELLPKGHLPIAGSSDLFTISLAPKTFGAVYWWFHETEELDDDGNFLPSAAYLLASSFDEFLTRIACLHDGRDAIEAGSAKPTASKASLSELLRTIKKEHTPQAVNEIKRLIKAAGNLSGIEDRQWPFINLGNAEVLGLLLDAGLNAEILDTEGQSLLWQCAGSPECIDLLVKHGVDVNRRSGSEGETALMRAIYLKRPEAIKQLIKVGANPTLRLDNHLAAELKLDTKLYKLVEKAKTDWQKRAAKVSHAPKPRVDKISKPVGEGPKPSLNKLLELLNHDRILENEVIDGLPEMIAAVGDLGGIKNGQWPTIDKFEDPQLLHTLLIAGLDPNITDKNGNTLLHQCALHPDCIALLLKSGAKVDVPNGKGETALMRATYVGDTECVQQLLDAGADPTIDFTPFARAMLRLNDEMADFIERTRQEWGSKKAKKSRTTRGR